MQTTEFQESRAKTRFCWIHHRPAAGSVNQLTRQPADAMVSMPGKQSQGYAVPLSILLEKLVKADLGKSVVIHPLKVLNNKSVITYMKKYQAATKASEKNIAAGSSAIPTKSWSETISDDDQHSLVMLAVARTGGAAAKSKIILAPSDSESTVSLTLPEIKKKQRTKRPKLINWATHFLPKIDLAAKGKEVMEEFARPNPVEEHCLLVIQSAWEVMSSKMSSFDEWARFRTKVRLNSIKSMTLIEMEVVGAMLYEKQLQEAVVKNRAEFDKAAPYANYDNMCIWFSEKELKEIIKQHRQAFYRKMEVVVASANTSKSALETTLVRNLYESHQHFASEMTLVKLQLAEMVNHLKELTDAKKGEGETSKRDDCCEDLGV
ncbi:pentatricopeptide repeat 5 [Dorcoceras hygrometricum]|uniref:Pentatricopeptide repeat 5 n=1 Tax=Dorcoceras hygrometricum TaxID=472368 RepID=A0A2Z7BBF0_9LAMI|nr:pentatricopeptide repeat 5 [Dorcoceras hygrometricum]